MSKQPLTLFGKYLSDKNIKPQDAARDLDVTRAYVQMLSCGSATPSLHIAWSIEKWSKGAVSMQSWLSAPKEKSA